MNYKITYRKRKGKIFYEILVIPPDTINGKQFITGEIEDKSFSDKKIKKTILSILDDEINQEPEKQFNAEDIPDPKTGKRKAREKSAQN